MKEQGLFTKIVIVDRDRKLKINKYLKVKDKYFF